MDKFTVITLDATLKSTLDWTQQIEGAKGANTKILWKLDFGFFDRLQYPLTSQQQFQALRLGIEHFQHTVWNELSEMTHGVLIYDGLLDVLPQCALENFNLWAKERFEKIEQIDVQDPFLHALFCRDVALDYIKQLAAQMPFGIDCYIEPKISSAMSFVERAIFLNKECYQPLAFIENLNDETDISFGVCLPPMTTYQPRSHRQLDTVVEEFISKGISYRFIAEEAFITSIEGLDEVFVSALTLTPQGKRKLQGFIAAGGEVHFLTN